MVIIANYKMIALDVNDLGHYKEFTDPLKLHLWIKEQEGLGKRMDFCTPQEFKWLKSYSGKKPKGIILPNSNNIKNKKVRTKKMIGEDD